MSVGPINLPPYGVPEYTSAFASLLPRGRVWPKTPDSNQGKLITGLVGSFSRLDAAARLAVNDANPALTVNLIDEWEQSVGLPDPCLGSTPTLEQRQQAVVARFTAEGGQSYSFYEQYAAALGYTITITPDAPFRIGWNGMGDPIGDISYFAVWHISSPSMSAQLQCEMLRVTPANTVLVFN